MTEAIKTLNDKTFYPVRGGNDLNKLKQWIRWAKKTYPEQKFKVKRVITERMLKDPYWKMRTEKANDDIFRVYGSY